MKALILQAVSNTHLKDLSLVKSLEYRADVPVGVFAAKAFAIIHSSFAEILCLDSDNIPLRDPSTLFAWPSYQQHGNVFWSDPNINPLDATVYEKFSLQPPWAEDPSFLASESGQILLNRYLSCPQACCASHSTVWSMLACTDCM